MTKRKEDLKKVVAFSITQEQEYNLKDLAEYTGLNVSEVLRALLPTTEQIDAFKTYQDFTDICGESNREQVLNKITDTKRIFMEVLMSNHFQAPIGLQVKATSYFDKTGKEIAKLFKNWINALRSFGGCRFKSERFKFANKPDYIYFCVLARGEKKKDVDNLIGKFCTLAPDAEVVKAISKSARLPVKQTKRKKKRKIKRTK